MGRLEAMFRPLVGPTSKIPVTLPPYTSQSSLLIHSSLPGMRRKSDIPDSVLRSVFADRLEKSFSEHLRIFTDDSVDSNWNSATVAVFFPALGYECAGKLPSRQPQQQQSLRWCDSQFSSCFCYVPREMLLSLLILQKLCGNYKMKSELV